MYQEIWFQKYQILGLLGKGGNAKVYLAEHIKLKSLRAIKFISKNHPIYELLSKEAIILKNLKHSSIPIIYDIEENEDGSYIIEQYLEGDTLKDIVVSGGAFQEDRILQIGLQLCDLIHYLHSVDRPILYIDMKPENILLCNHTLKLVDFGSAIYLDDKNVNPIYSATPGYAAPELYSKSLVDERCDVYGIGCLLYYMVTGQSITHYSEGMNHIDYYGSYSKGLKKVISRCLKYQPSQRYASVKKLSKQLTELKQKAQSQTEKSHTIKIAIAGSQPRIGVTHTSLRICKYLLSVKEECLYQEKNENGCVWTIRSRSDKVDINNGVYVIEGIPMLPYQQCTPTQTLFYHYIVQDFGQLTQENLSEYLSAELKLYLLGAKEWEQDFTEQGIHKVEEDKEVIYLFNYLNGKQFHHLMKRMDRKNCYRIPYEPDVFGKVTQQNGLEFFREIIQRN